MSELESLALLIADLHTQVRALQAENVELRSAPEKSEMVDMSALREKSFHHTVPDVPWGHGEYCGIDPYLAAICHNAELLSVDGGCPDCGKTTHDGAHEPGCDWERCKHNLQLISCDKEHN